MKNIQNLLYLYPIKRESSSQCCANEEYMDELFIHYPFVLSMACFLRSLQCLDDAFFLLSGVVPCIYLYLHSSSRYLVVVQYGYSYHDTRQNGKLGPSNSLSL